MQFAEKHMWKILKQDCYLGIGYPAGLRISFNLFSTVHKRLF